MVDPQSVDQQGSDICGKQLSTFNDIFFNLRLISIAKVRIKEPASKSLNNATAVECRHHKQVIPQKVECYQLRRGTEASRRLRLHGRMALSRREASIRPAHARRFRDHLDTDSVRSKLPPLCMLVSPSPVSRDQACTRTALS